MPYSKYRGQRNTCSRIEGQISLGSLSILNSIFQNFVMRLRIVDSIQRALKLFCDNDSAVKFSNNNKSSRKFKFVSLKFLIVKERVQGKELSITRICTNSII